MSVTGHKNLRVSDVIESGLVAILSSNPPESSTIRLQPTISLRRSLTGVLFGAMAENMPEQARTEMEKLRDEAFSRRTLVDGKRLVLLRT
jgi:hypothetical protein